MIEHLSHNLKPNLLIFLLASIAVMILSTTYASFFKKPVNTYRAKLEQSRYLEQRPFNPDVSEIALEKLKQEIGGIEEKIREKTSRDILRQSRPLFVITKLGDLAREYTVQVASITPGNPVVGDVYTVTTIIVDLVGSYKQLYQWIYALEHSGSPVLIRDFELTSGNDENDRQMSINLELIQLNTER